ncbi:AAA family ATPase [Paractinoplanes durhamensis]|uniref:AAA family ATPase n=1 Tax=Paractinoplanes durhamensis TaxID=113563 RepID=UPI00194313DD|nr:AAA family ATPase [Actinoplanes durhamensis]
MLDTLELEVQRQILQTKARQMAAERLAAERFDPAVFSTLGGSLDEMLARPVVGERYLIERLLGARHNMVLAAQYKTGKTTMGVNLIKSLADGAPFLGHKVMSWEGRVAWWNGEMDDQDFHDYVRPLKVKNPKRVQLLHLRGRPVSILDPHSAEMVVKHLRDNEIGFWGVDSWRRFCAWNGVNENDNEAVERLTTRVDEIKERSGCDVFAAIAHTPRAAMEEGEERARGAAALDDWVDARWVLTKNRDGDRFLAVTGRGVGLEETKLEFNPATYRLTLGEGNRRTAVNETLRLGVSMALKGAPDGLLTGELADVVKVPRQKSGALKPVLEALIDDRSVTVESAPRNGKRYRWNG